MPAWARGNSTESRRRHQEARTLSKDPTHTETNKAELKKNFSPTALQTDSVQRTSIPRRKTQ